MDDPRHPPIRVICHNSLGPYRPPAPPNCAERRNTKVAYCGRCGHPLQKGEGMRAEVYGQMRVVCRDVDACGAREVTNEYLRITAREER